MSDNPTPDPTPTPQGQEPNPSDAPKTDEPAGDSTDWKAEARKWEQRAKADAGAAAKLAEIEEASKTEAQRQADALAAAQAELQEFKTKEQVSTWKAQVSQATGVPVSALAGSTEEEIKAHAEILKPLIGSQNNGPRAPREGLTPAGDPADQDRRSFVRGLTGRD